MHFIYNVFPLKWLRKSCSPLSLCLTYHLLLQISQSSQVKHDQSGEVRDKKKQDCFKMPEKIEICNSKN